MMPAAEVTPSKPKGVKSERLSEFHPVTPTATKNSRTLILIATITVLTVADSLAPRISSSMQSTIRTTAGRLKIPSASGALARFSGMTKPKRLSNSSLRYCDQPTATAAEATPYSQQQAGGDHDRHSLAQRGVGVGVGGAGHRHRAGQLGVADRGEAGDQARRRRRTGPPRARRPEPTG